MPISLHTNTQLFIQDKNKIIHGSRDNNFNFLRLLFASLVLVSHATEIADGNRNNELLTRIFHSLSFGEVAVDGFFLLSGYLIVKSWEHTPNLLFFAKKRIRRIYPGFIAAFLLCVFCIAPFAASNPSTYFSELSYAGIVSSIMQLKAPTVPKIFAGTPYPVINGAMWSIFYEVRCYLLVAIIGLAGVRHQRTIWVICLIATLALLPINDQLNKLSFPGSYRLIDSPSSFFRLLTFFSVGACFYLFRNVIILKGSLAAVATLIAVILLFHPDLASLGLATFGAYALFWVAFASVPALNTFKRLDDVSYGLYLYGWPIQKMLNWYFPTSPVWLLLVIALALALVAGYISWHVVESPFLKSKKVNSTELQKA
jgi:peptidoglycan/LPS O-acetylase OafA/YrhL